LYAVWVKIDESMPWLELKGLHSTRKEALQAARGILSKAEIKVVKMCENKTKMKALITIKQ
jgi:hypothetical protein